MMKGKWYEKVIEIDDKEYEALRGKFKKMKLDDCFKCEEDIKL